MWENILIAFIAICFISLFVAIIVIVYERITIGEEIKTETKSFEIPGRKFDNTNCKIESLARMIFSLKLEREDDTSSTSELAKEAIEEAKLFYKELNKRNTTVTFNDGTEVTIEDYGKRRCQPASESQCSAKLSDLKKEHDESFQDLVEAAKGVKEKISILKNTNSKIESLINTKPNNHV